MSALPLWSMMRNLGFTWLDLVALVWFFVWWLGYARFAEWHGRRVPSLLSAMEKYRRDWWVRTLERELRMIDTAIIANLSNSSTFFASTTLLILGGLLALLGTTEKVSAVVQGLPFKPADVGDGLGAEDPAAGGDLRLRVL